MNKIDATILNKSWAPLLSLVLTFSVIFIYGVYPMLYNIGYGLGWNLVLPSSIPDNLNALLLGSSLMATVRTAEKKFKVVDTTDSSMPRITSALLAVNKYWRPLLMFSIIFITFYLYVIIPVEVTILHIDKLSDVVPAFMYDKLKELLITGGFFASLKVGEKALGVDTIH